MRRLVLRIVLVLGPSFVLLGAGELALRVFGVEPTCSAGLQIDCGRSRRGDDWRCDHILLQQNRFQADPELLWVPRPGKPPFNELGYRGPMVERERRPGVAATWSEPATWADDVCRAATQCCNAGSRFADSTRLQRFANIAAE